MKDVICECGHGAAKHGDGCYAVVDEALFGLSKFCKCEKTIIEVLRAHIERLEVAIEAFRASNGRVGESLNKLEDELNELRFQD